MSLAIYLRGMFMCYMLVHAAAMYIASASYAV
jgi:hypothetical protein